MSLVIGKGFKHVYIAQHSLVYCRRLTESGLLTFMWAGSGISALIDKDLNKPAPTVNSQQSTVNGQQSTVNGQRSTVNSQQSTVNSQRSTVNGQQSTVNSQQSS